MTHTFLLILKLFLLFVASLALIFGILLCLWWTTSTCPAPEISLSRPLLFKVDFTNLLYQLVRSNYFAECQWVLARVGLRLLIQALLIVIFQLIDYS